MKLRSAYYIVTWICTIRHARAFSPNAITPHGHRLDSKNTFFGGRTMSPRNSNKDDISGGIFFDGPSDFSSPQSSSGSIQPPMPKRQSKGRLSKRKSFSTSTLSKDIVIIGAGLAGLSAAFHIILNSDRHVTILEKEDFEQQMKQTTAGSFAAAGMLAPQSERLPSGPLLNLCFESRDMYTNFIQTVEEVASNCGPEAAKYLWQDTKSEVESGLEPWEVGYSATGGFLAPAFAGDSVATWSPPTESLDTAKWLDEIQVREMEPNLHPDVVGGWWFPEDASVDARRLTCSLRAACAELGVQFMWGEGCAADSLELGGGRCKGVRLSDGRIISAESIVLSNGSWMRNLLPVPVTPHKGQSFSLRMPPNTEPLLKRVLFAQDTYIVPKADGRIVVGATVEVGSFDPSVTPAGMIHCMSNAFQLVPGLEDLPIEETWAGLRPTTPDKGPILGRSSWENLFLAGGYWRNGVLLAPKTGQLLGDLILNDGQSLEDEDEIYLNAFSWDRFTHPGGGKTLAANTRYAASMHPVHKRSSGIGVAAAVGTELGFYSGASDAVEERKKDRESLFQEGEITGTEDDIFEQAAALGMADATAFSYEGMVEKPKTVNKRKDEDTQNSQPDTHPFDGAPDAFTVGYSETEEKSEESDDMESVYKKIAENKAVARDIQMTESIQGKKDDPGFRLYHVHAETREVTEVSPFQGLPVQTQSSEDDDDDDDDDSTKDTPTFEQIEDNDQKRGTEYDEEKEEPTQNSDANVERTFDGYQTIQRANSRHSRSDELEVMKKSRSVNRVNASKIDEAHIGVKKEKVINISVKDDDDDMPPSDQSLSLKDIYSQIKENKRISNKGIKMKTEKSSVEEENPADPGFRLYHVDKESREETLVPPYASSSQISENDRRMNLTNEKQDSAEDAGITTYESSNNIMDGTGLDGYQVIQKANGSSSREEELRAMRNARISNRNKTNF